MPKEIFRKKIVQLLSFADVKVNGDRPWDLKIHNKKFFARILAAGSLGLGESYVDGWWDCEKLDEFIYRILCADLGPKVKPWIEYFDSLRAKFFNLQKPSRAFKVGKHHYDISNDLYEKMLDKRLIYSCGYWKNATNLDEAQKAKLDLICRKLNIETGMRILDIGCGWGGTAKFISERYGAEVVGVTISKKQEQFAKNLCRNLPVKIYLQDYRTLKGSFDRILSIGMFEHVGYKNYSTFMQIVKNNLKANGLFLLHTIGHNLTSSYIDPWINRYIFPNAMLPSPKQICKAIEGKFVLEDWHNFSIDYDRTLMQWFTNFHNNWPILKNNYSKHFYRMWKYYLLACAGTFRARQNQVWQIVLSPRGVPEGYIICR